MKAMSRNRRRGSPDFRTPSPGGPALRFPPGRTGSPQSSLALVALIDSRAGSAYFREHPWHLTLLAVLALAILAALLASARRRRAAGVRRMQEMEIARTRAEKELASATREFHRLSTQLLAAQDSERRRLARELHDGAAQLIAGLSLNLFRLRDLDPGPARDRLVSESIDLAAQAASQVRTLSYELHPPLLDELGLASALRAFAEAFEGRAGITVETNIDLGPARLAGRMELALFRIAQDATVNAHRQSGSPRVVISLQRGAKQLSLSVQDFVGAPGPPQGVEILAIGDRAAQLGGRMTLTSTPGGTTVTVTLPVENDDEEDSRADCR